MQYSVLIKALGWFQSAFSMAPLTENCTLVKLKPIVNSDQWGNNQNKRVNLFSPELNKESAERLGPNTEKLKVPMTMIMHEKSVESPLNINI